MDGTDGVDPFPNSSKMVLLDEHDWMTLVDDFGSNSNNVANDASKNCTSFLKGSLRIS